MLKRKSLKPSRKRKGQSTVEYIILVAAVIAIIFVFLNTGGPFRTAYNATLTSGINGMQDMANRLQRSRPTS